jgi:hypothetical protein
MAATYVSFSAAIIKIASKRRQQQRFPGHLQYA